MVTSRCENSLDEPRSDEIKWGDIETINDHGSCQLMDQQTHEYSDWAKRSIERFSKCPVCESEAITYAFRLYDRRLDECMSCGLLFFNPQPTDAELDSIYGSDYSLGEERAEGSPETRFISLKRSSAAMILDMVSRYSRWRDFQGRRLLDIGCGQGFLAAEAIARGYEVTGVDVSEELLGQAGRYASNAETYIMKAEDLDFDHESFDVCTLVDVLEHTRNPYQVLKKVWQMLKSGGILVLAMPSLDSVTARIMKERWFEFKQEHLFYFKTSTVQTLLYRAGFSAIQMHPHKKALDLKLVKSHLDRYPLRSAVARRLAGLTDRMPEWMMRKPWKLAPSGSVALATKGMHPRDKLAKLSVILPVYNERQTFPVLAEALTSTTIHGMEMEIIIVESNSTDGTREQVLNLRADPRVKIVLQDGPKGKGNAVREGLRCASGDIVLIQDGDLEYDLNDYEPLLRPLLQHRASFTLGMRHRGGAFKIRRFIDAPTIAWLINLGHYVLTGSFNLLYRQHLVDPWTMFKVFRRDCITNMEFECDGFDFDIELVIKIIKRGFTPVEIPVNYVSRSFAQGKKVSFLRDPVRICKAMAKYRIS